MIILLDQDGVLADFEGAFREHWISRYPAIPPVPEHARRSFQIKDDYPEDLRAQVEAIYRSPGFFRSLPPIPGALQGLRDMVAAGWEVFICTSPLRHYEHCVLEKYQWVEQHLGHAFTSRIILTRDKTLVDGDVLVDDKPMVTGVRTPRWRHLIYDQPYNRDTTALRMSWENWREILMNPRRES